ncbi:MAG: MBL fold metallo-hydrolase [Crenarchaeota archaeon]|nr:MBL fold metallo-hydrolase [Thermoproteota archaeon]
MVLRVLRFVVGPLDTNCYLAYDEGSHEGIVIDPGGAPDELSELLSWVHRLGIEVAAIIVTHGHFDHFLGAPYLSRKLGVDVYMNRRDEEVARVSLAWAQAFGYRAEVPSAEDLSDGMEIHFGSYRAVAIETPGHSPGSTCIYIDGESTLFSGDTLFCGTVGRTDLPGGSAKDLARSIARLYSALPLDTYVYPGHGPSTTLRRELRANPFVEDALRLASHGSND